MLKLYFFPPVDQNATPRQAPKVESAEKKVDEKANLKTDVA